MPGLVRGGDDSMYCLSRKRSRVNAPYNFIGDLSVDDEKPQPQPQPRSLDDFPEEYLFEILRRLGTHQDRSIAAGVCKSWLWQLTSIPALNLPVRTVSDASSEKVMGMSELNTNSKPSFEVEAMSKTMTVSEPEPETDHASLGDSASRYLEGGKDTDIRLAAIAVCTARIGGPSALGIHGNNLTSGPTDIGLTALGKGGANLTYLSLKMLPHVTDAGLLKLATGCPMLQTLELSNLPLISDNSLLYFAMKCPNLSFVTIEGCPRINGAGLLGLGQWCKKLKYISIENCPSLRDAGIHGLVSGSSSLSRIRLCNLPITDSSLTSIGSSASSVDELVLTDLPNVSEMGFGNLGLAKGLHNLRTLRIKSCLGLTDRSLPLIAMGCPELCGLETYKCCCLSDTGLIAFLASARKLVQLQIDGSNMITLRGLFDGLVHSTKKLEELVLVECLGINDIGLNSALLPVLPCLQTLTIRDCPGLTSLPFTGKICPKLEEIELIGLVGINDDDLLPLIHKSETGLVRVTLNGCVNLTDSIVARLIEVHGNTLERLRLDGCKNVTDSSLWMITTHCSVLNDIDLSNSGITDEGVKILASGRMVNLVRLGLGGCSVSDESRPYLVNMGQSLYELDIKCCSSFSASAISLLSEELVGCEILS